MMAFSITATIDFSQGVTVSVRESSIATLAVCVSGTLVP